MQVEQSHPADELAKSLARAEGILTLLAGCYERETKTFATGNSFVNEAVLAIETILGQANKALERLYQSCDLTIVRSAPVTPEVVAVAESSTVVAEAVQIPPLPAPEPSTHLSQFGPRDDAVKIAPWAGRARVNSVSTLPVQPMEKPAETYDEFLQKLTGASDKTATATDRTSPDSEQMSAIEGLRSDLTKQRSAG